MNSAVRAPSRAVVIRGILREPAGAESFAVEVDQPQIGAALVRFHVGFRDDISDIVAVGGDLRVADPLEPHEIVGRKCGGLGESCGAGHCAQKPEPETCRCEHEVRLQGKMKAHILVELAARADY